MEKIRIRPSSLAGFVSCPKQWYNVFILGETTIPNVRAIIGTGIHAGAEAVWREAIKTQEKKPNLTMMKDAAVEAYDKEIKESEQVKYDSDINDNIARATIIKGTKAYAEDIMPFTIIPKKVETRVTVKIDHPIVKDISGTIDYLTEDTIADIKTSKRKVVPQGHTLQQSVYTYLANENGYNITSNQIQGIILAKTKIVGGIDALETNIPQAKYIINNLLDRLEALHNGTDPELLFPGNPKHYLCSDMYCSLRPTCKFVHGDIV